MIPNHRCHWRSPVWTSKLISKVDLNLDHICCSVSGAGLAGLERYLLPTMVEVTNIFYGGRDWEAIMSGMRDDNLEEDSN
jgi:hypothetical protein